MTEKGEAARRKGVKNRVSRGDFGGEFCLGRKGEEGFFRGRNQGELSEGLFFRRVPEEMDRREASGRDF